ncbi:MAG: aminoacyl-tRNA hydrolase [Betaproteobacteria bacterium]|nr:aminoacyl-tRNA hydrolase [Betaproteobacteria bacterium]
MTPPRLIVGLGNPGREYAATRHNAGFWWLERIAALERVALGVEARFTGRVGKAGSELWLLEPQGYMNRSGLSVGTLARYYRIPPEAILVAHDELDLLPGDLRLKLGGGHAGHNGLRDIVAQLGSPNFWRLRIGIGHPRQNQAEAVVADYVLNAPRREEQIRIDEAIDRATAAWPQLKAGEFERATQALHTKPKP